MHNKRLSIALGSAFNQAQQLTRQLKNYAVKNKIELSLGIGESIARYHRKKALKRYGSSKYTPHQSGQECVRRRSQINKGIIPFDQTNIVKYVR